MENKRKMKAKSFIFTIVLVIVFSTILVACGKDDKKADSSLNLVEEQNTVQETKDVAESSTKEDVKEDLTTKEDEPAFDTSTDEGNVADKPEYKGKIEKSDEVNEELARMDSGNPNDNVTIPFSKEIVFNFKDYEDLAQKGSMDETNIDQLVEGVSDMLANYHQGEYDDAGYENFDGNFIYQEFYNDSEYGTRVTHTCIWTGNELVDKVMKGVGYKEYEINYFYPFGMWISDRNEVTPVYVSLLVDGVGFEYYFADNELVRRLDPESESNNPKTNDFLNSLYKIGCYYGNTLEGERNLYTIAVYSVDRIGNNNDSFAINGTLLGRNKEVSFVIDKDTVYDDEYGNGGVTGSDKGESFYDWYCNTYDAVENGDDGVAITELLGCWVVKITNDHVDSVCGTYWWD